MPNWITFDTQNSAVGVTSINCDLPVHSGDTTSVIYVVLVNFYSTNPVTATLAGWNLAGSVAAHATSNLPILNFYQAVYWKPYDGSVGVSVTFSSTCNASIQSRIATEASPSSPNAITIINTSDITDSSSHPAPTGTTTHDNSLLVGAWLSPVAEAIFTPPASMITDFSQTATSGSTPSQPAVLIATEVKATAGPTGTRTATSRLGSFTGPAYQVNSIATLFAINPSQVPSAPVLITPNGGESYTKGVPIPASWTPSTSPTVAQNLLTYKIRISSNGPFGPWTVVTAGTSAGATTFSIPTSSLTPGTNYYLEVKANDGSNDGPADVSASAFSILFDVPPSAPTNLSPNGTTVDRASNRTFSYTFNDIGDIHTERTWEWGTAGSTFPNVTTTTTGTTSFTVTGGTGILATRGQKYWRVKTEDNAGNASPYSATATFFAGDKPAAPVIVSPTNASPPTESLPIITITSTGHIGYRYRFVREGSQVFDSGIITSSAVSWRDIYALAEGVAIKLLVSVIGPDGIASDEAEETFTPTYTTPDKPTVAVQANDAGGYIQVTVGNTGSLSHNDFYRYDDSQSPAEMIKVAKQVNANGSFQDYNVASGVTYYYIVRAVGNTAALFKDSDSSEGVSVTLTKLWLHAVTKESSTSNASGSPVSLTNLEAPGQNVPEKIHGREFKFVGREKPVYVSGEAVVKSLRASCLESDSTKRTQVKAIYDAGANRDTHICVRDQLGEKIIGKFASFPLSMTKHDSIEIFVRESDYTEALP